MTFAKRHHCLLWVIAFAMPLACLLAGAARADDKAAATPDQLKFFESSVRPILVKHCQKCHSGDDPKGELSLESRSGLLTGGASGQVVTPGNPSDSALVAAINYADLEMPPDDKLDETDIATLTEWVRLGAPWPDEPDSGEGPTLRQRRDKITAEDKNYWAFQPLKVDIPPNVEGDHWSHGDIDRFLLSRMQAESLQPASAADKRTLIRRLSFDLLGLPPQPEEVAAFTSDSSPQAYEQLVDRMLANPRYGEHWARHWLDLVRYAESDGYKADAYRPDAWRYRDYVIRSLNEDKPYDRFVREQIAGDELDPDNSDAIVATGYYRLGIYEYNQRDVKTQWDNILNEITDVTADVFLGLGVSCARCHDHKFDPILQEDYFRLKAFFAPLVQHDAPLPSSAADVAVRRERQVAWEEKTADIRRQLDELERPLVDDAAAKFIKKFPSDIEPLFGMSPADRAPLQEQLCKLASRQIIEEGGKIDFAQKLKGEQLEKWKSLRKQLAEYDSIKPASQPNAMSISDVGAVPPPVTIPGKRDAKEIQPGLLSVIDPAPVDCRPLSPTSKTTGRRSALAAWLTRPDNPLTARVIVNRVWQQHFGRGLVETASDFGRLGQPPTHPELLDHLTSRFIESGWSLKWLHRQILLSAAYRQTSYGEAVSSSSQKDPTNRWLARMTVRRLTAEQIRDAGLLTTGQLDLTAEGPSSPWDSRRRSIYLKTVRNSRDLLLDAFDIPDGSASVPQRNITTTPTQALTLVNGPWMLGRAKDLAKRLEREVPAGDSNTAETRINKAYQLALGRDPSAGELSNATAFLAADGNSSGLIDFCHVLLNSNEFLYVD